MHILAIIAGTNHPSNSATLAFHFLEGAKEAGAETETVYLKDLSIEHFHLGHYAPGTDQGEHMRMLWEKISNADGVLIASPIWNFAVPAHLKNFVDRLGAFGLDGDTRSKGTLKGKPFFFLLTGGSPQAAWLGMMRKTTSFLQEGLRYFDASIIGTFFEGRTTLGRGKFGLIVDKRPDRLAAAKAEGKKFAAVTRTYKETGKAPVAQRLWNKMMKTGEKMLKAVTGA